MHTSIRFAAFKAAILLCMLSFASQATSAVYTLTLDVDGAGGVTRNPTNSAYPNGAVVVLTATSDTGWLFAGWSGDASGSANPLNVTMNSNKTIIAHFTQIPSYILSVSVSGYGSVSLDAPGGSYLSNTTVTATAMPDAGWVFAGWSGDASGNVNPLAIKMNASKSVTAVFAELPSITSPPQDALAEVGDTASFSVQANGTAPLAYQWYFGGLPVSGAAFSALSLTNIQPTQAGDYWAVVSNTYGTATSRHATLTVRDACAGTNVVSNCTEASLRMAMSAGGLVRLCCNGTIVLSNTIDVIQDVALDARDRNVIISGNNAVRLFTVSPGVRFSITNLVLANGRHQGADGANAPSTQPGSPGFPGQGGAIYNDGGVVEITSSTLTNNRAVGGNGGTGDVSRLASGGDASGGAVFTRGGHVRLQGVELSQNVVVGGRGANPAFFALGSAGNGFGGAVYASNAIIETIECNITGNRSVAQAGDIGAAWGGAYFLAFGSLLLSNCIIAWNVSVGSNAPLFQGVSIPASSSYGGAIAATSGFIAIEHTRFISNSVHGGNGNRYGFSGKGRGGAVYSFGTLVASKCSFLGNNAMSGGLSALNPTGAGGAICNGGAMVFNACSFYLNSAIGGGGVRFGVGLTPFPAAEARGGAIFNEGQLAVTNCTVVLNSANGGNSGLPSSGIGGGVYSVTGLVSVVNTTISSNSVVPGVDDYLGTHTEGTAVGANIGNTNGTFTLRNSIIAHGGTNGNAWGTITDGGFNINSDGSANFNSGSSFSFTDPQLGPLADYGGPTLTMALLPNSPAIDFGSAEGAPLVDQRGRSRPFGTGVDMGAYEFYSNQTELPRLSISSALGSVTLKFDAFPATEYQLQTCEKWSLPWDDLETIGPFTISTNVTRTISTHENSSRFFRLKIQ